MLTTFSEMWVDIYIEICFLVVFYSSDFPLQSRPEKLRIPFRRVFSKSLIFGEPKRHLSKGKRAFTETSSFGAACVVTRNSTLTKEL